MNTYIEYQVKQETPSYFQFILEDEQDDSQTELLIIQSKQTHHTDAANLKCYLARQRILIQHIMQNIEQRKDIIVRLQSRQQTEQKGCCTIF